MRSANLVRTVCVHLVLRATALNFVVKLIAPDTNSAKEVLRRAELLRS